MPRKPRISAPGFPMHVMQRGLNRSICFAKDTDMKAYAHWLHEGAIKYNVEIHAWVFMSNHTHLLVTPKEQFAVSRLMQYLGRLYVRKFNYTYERSGGLFEDRFRSNLVEEERYLLACMRYIELNPVRAGMVEDPGDYVWSSYRAHAFGQAAGMWTPHPRYLALGEQAPERQAAYREFVSSSVDAELISEIRRCSNKGLVLGSDRFRQQFRELTGDDA